MDSREHESGGSVRVLVQAPAALNLTLSQGIEIGLSNRFKLI